MKAFGSGKFIIEGSLNFKRKEDDPFHLETKISIKTSCSDSDIFAKLNAPKRARFSEESVETTPRADLGNPKYEAAVKLQEFYKRYRTRTQFADCAVLIEQKWWKLLDFALLKRSSVSFFDIGKPESAVSKWSRARTRAAKVGKGLSKNSKAQKLAIQHWLEVIDPRHRYGHNLHFYYDRWLRCESKQPFFYWLDVGEGKEVNLEACLRPKLQQQCIKYLGPKEREVYEVIIEEGRLMYKKNRKILDTTGGPKDSKWIFVLSTSKNLYVGLKKKGHFQHSSFLAGGATSAAGRLVVENGILKSVWPHSVHYRPTEENFEDFMSFPEENNVVQTDVKKSPYDCDEEWGTILESRNSESDLTGSNVYTESQIVSEFPESISTNKSLKIGEVDEEKGSDSRTESKEEFLTTENSGDESMESSDVLKPKFFIEEQEEGDKELGKVSEELIIDRISSKEGVKTCQLGQILPLKWTTGAGARIGYVRNYPSELQFLALEQVNLSPRSCGISRPFSSPRGKSTWLKTNESCTLKDTMKQSQQ